MKKIQIKTGSGWRWVFCWNPKLREIVTCDDKRKALPPAPCWGESDLAYMAKRAPEAVFRLAESLTN